MEDKIVGPLTLTQFLFVLAGSVIDYAMFQTIGKTAFPLFLLLAVPIGLVALAFAFLKIQDQPLMHFISAGLVYLTKPKVRIWQRQYAARPVLTAAPPPPPKTAAEEEGKHLEKATLEQLAYNLDIGRVGVAETHKSNFGRTAAAFEKLLRSGPALEQKPKH